MYSIINQSSSHLSLLTDGVGASLSFEVPGSSPYPNNKKDIFKEVKNENISGKERGLIKITNDPVGLKERITNVMVKAIDPGKVSTVNHIIFAFSFFVFFLFLLLIKYELKSIRQSTQILHPLSSIFLFQFLLFFSFSFR